MESGLSESRLPQRARRRPLLGGEDHRGDPGGSSGGDCRNGALLGSRYSDPAATEYLTKTLLERRTKVLATWLNGTNPIVDAALDASGRLTFENAAEKAAVGAAAERYTVQWSRFDNATGTQEMSGAEQTLTAKSAQAPAALLGARPEYIAARLQAFHADRPAWAQPLTVYFRRAGDGWTLVGLERNP
jgi:hypothetical protein